MTISKAMMSSARADWTTPGKLFKKLNRIFGGFTLDAAASPRNALVRNYYTAADDALGIEWTDDAGDGPIWLNPPYGRKLIHWIRKAREQADRGVRVMLLIPARTETKWFRICWESEAIVFFYRRIKFGEGVPVDVGIAGAPFPSALVIMGGPLSPAESAALSKMGKVIEP